MGKTYYVFASKRRRNNTAGTVIGCFFLLVLVFIASISLSQEGPKDEIMHTFTIKPGEQVVKCAPQRLRFDFNSPYINVYESDGYPAMSAHKERKVSEDYSSTISTNTYSFFVYNLPPLSTINAHFTFKNVNETVFLLQGKDNFDKYVTDVNRYFREYDFEYLSKETGDDVTIDETTNIYDTYYIILEPQKQKISYEATINITRRQYYVSDLKKACSNKEHKGNCIVNDDKKSSFCAIIDYDNTRATTTKEVTISAYKSVKSRGKDDVSDESTFSSDEPASTTTYDPQIDDMPGSSRVSVEDEDDRGTFVILAVVTGILIVVVVVVGVFLIYLYIKVKANKNSGGSGNVTMTNCGNTTYNNNNCGNTTNVNYNITVAPDKSADVSYPAAGGGYGYPPPQGGYPPPPPQGGYPPPQGGYPPPGDMAYPSAPPPPGTY